MSAGGGLAGRVRAAADVGLGAVFAVALAFQAVQLAGSWGGDYWWFGLAAGTVVCVVALARRRDCLWAAVAGLVAAAGAILVSWFEQLPSEPSPAMALALAVLVGSAVRRLPALQAGAVAACGLAVVSGSLLAALTSPSGSAVPVLNAVGWIAALAAGLGGRSLEARRRAIAERARREERLELARELHDVVAHHITSIVLLAQAAPIVARKRPEAVADSLADIEAAGSAALAATRRVVSLLRDTNTNAGANANANTAAPGQERLSELVDRFSGNGPTVRLRLPDGEPGWPSEVASTVHRIVRESLTNIARHAPHARSVTVSVTQDRESLTVEVTDDATPARLRNHHRGGYGLVGMRERVEALGGTLRAAPRPEAGWSVLATLPLPVRKDQ